MHIYKSWNNYPGQYLVIELKEQYVFEPWSTSRIYANILLRYTLYGSNPMIQPNLCHIYQLAYKK